jgi:hypothetical protein
MAIEVEVNMRIPTLTLRSATENDRKVDNKSVRFTKRIQVPAIPKPGELIQLTTQPDSAFACTVTRAEWHEAKAMFIVSCSYAKRSISSDEYQALVQDPDWRMKDLI